MNYYKLTDKDGRTRGGMDWSVGKTNRATGKGTELCTDGYLHVYDTPEQAVFMALAHVRNYTRMFEVRSKCKGISDGTKRGIKSCTVVKEIPMPEMTTKQRVEIAIRVSLLVYKEKGYVKWAKNWLSGKDRSRAAAYAASYAAAHAAAHAAAYAAAHAAAADDAADDAAAAHAAADADAYAAAAAHAAAHAAAYYAADSAADAPIPLVEIISKVMKRFTK